MSLLTAMGAVLLTWAVVSLAFIGIGLLIQRPFQLDQTDPERFLAAFWLGVGGSVLLLQAWSFFAPINFAVLIIFVAIGTVGVSLEGATLRAAFACASRHPSRCFITLLMIVWLANRAIGPGDMDDSGLYHFAIVRWANEFPVVPGIANLSPAFALNNSSLLLVAMLNTGPLAGRGQHFANGLLLAAMFVQVICGFAAIWKNSTPKWQDVFDAMLLAPVMLYALGREISTPTTDLPVGAVILATTSIWLRAIDRPTAFRVFTVLVMSAVAVTMKLSAGVFTGLISLITIAIWLKHSPPRERWRIPAAGVIVGMLLAGTWMARSVIQSGYPLYPSSALPMPVAWRTSPENLTFLFNSITQQSRGGLQIWLSEKLEHSPLRWYVPLIKPPFDTRDGISGLNWVRSWIFVQPITGPIEVVVPLLLGVVALPFALGAEPSRRRALKMLLVATIPELLFWFIQSPDRRYVWQVTWSFAAGLIAIAASGAAAVRKMIALSCACAFIAIGYRFGLLLVLRDANPLSQIPFIVPGADHGFHPRPEPDLVRWTSRRGLTVFTTKPDTAPLVWAHALPAAAWPAPDPDLRLRRDDDLGSGFVIDRRRD